MVRFVKIIQVLAFVALFILAFGRTMDEAYYQRWKLMADYREQLRKSVENAHHTRHRQYYRNPESLSKLLQQSYDDWELYKSVHDKNFDSHDEETEKMMAFLSAQSMVKRHNEAYEKGKASHKLGVNHIADLPFSEYQKLNGFKKPANRNLRARTANQASFLPLMNVRVPDAIDWRDHGYVTEVKNQGMCGSCWAFSSTGALEGQHMRATGKLVSLSEQNLIDCSVDYGNLGCEGGLMDDAFQYVRDIKGIDTEQIYPYLGEENESCNFSRSGIGATDYGFVDLPEGDEEQLKIAVATQGPISVAIDAGHKSFQLYKEGVYYEPACSPEKLDHGVLVVGYGTDKVYGDYWIVKNSWGTSWGENGYIRMPRNRDNHCGIASMASYPLV